MSRSENWDREIQTFYPVKLWFADWLFKNRNSQIAFYNGSPSLLNTKYWLGFSSQVVAGGGGWLVAPHIKCDSRSQVVRKSVPVIVNICPHPSLDLQTSQPQSPPPPPDNVGITSTYLCLPSLLTNNTRVTEFFFSVKCFNRKSLSLSAVDSQQKVVFIIIMTEKMGNLNLFGSPTSTSTLSPSLW